MASYLELYGLQNNDDLHHKIATAVIVAADAIRTEDGAVVNHANRLLWARAAFESPLTIAQHVMWAVLAANKDATVANILAATDSSIQTAVDNVIDVFANGA